MDLGSLIDVEEMVRFIEEEEEEVEEVEVFLGGTLEVEAREWPPLLITGLADLLAPLEVEELALVLLLLLLLLEVLLVEAFPVGLEKDEEEEEDEEEEAELLEALEVVLEAAEAVVCCGSLASSIVLTRRGGRSSMRYLKRIGSFLPQE